MIALSILPLENYNRESERRKERKKKDRVLVVILHIDESMHMKLGMLA